MQQKHVDMYVQRGLESSRDPRGDLKSDRRELSAGLSNSHTLDIV